MSKYSQRSLNIAIFILIIERLNYLKMNRQKVIKFLAHPLFIAVVITLIAFPFTIGLFPHYRAKVVKAGIIDKPDGIIYWCDYNNDGESEQFTWFSNTEGKAAFKVTGQNELFMTDYNFNGQTNPERSPLFFGDNDNDGKQEVFAFYHRNDSLFLSSIEFVDDTTLLNLFEKFITMVTNKKGKPDYGANISFLEDIDKDSHNELIFSVIAGHSIVPRNIFIYNIMKDSLFYSGFTGPQAGVTVISDINRDGKKELFIHQYAMMNMKGYQIEGTDDNSVRLLVLNHKLEKVAESEPISGDHPGLNTIPVFYKDGLVFAALLTNIGIKSPVYELLLYSADGKLIRKKNLSTKIEKKNLDFIRDSVNSGAIKIIDDKGLVTFYDTLLNIISEKHLPDIPSHKHNRFDLDRDGQKEFVFSSGFEQFITITRSDLSDPKQVELTHESPFIDNMTVKINNGKSDELSLQAGRKYFLVEYKPDPLYPFRFLFIIAGFGILTGFIYLIQYMQRLTLRERYLAERRVADLQLRLMKNQLDPHFLFNAINSISYEIAAKKPEEAHNTVVKLSRLMRNTLMVSDKLSRSLKEELDAVALYLEINRTQQEKSFSYKFDIDPEVDMEMQVPALAVQNFAENAVKHGIRSLGEKGCITITARMDNSVLLITITDNGIGRQEASLNKQPSESTHMGIGLMHQFFSLVNKYNEKKIACTITDLTNPDGSPAGTEVRLEIPKQMKYRIYE